MSETTLTETTEQVATPQTRGYRPQVDIYETEDQFAIVADVPGSSEQDIDLSVEKDVLTLHARVAEPQFEGYEARWRGYGVGDWKRSFRLSEAVDREGIDASVKDGVLRVTLPKGKAALKKSIPVKRLD
jgi:HSP20 family molecular chaperone IbpA